MEKLTIESTLNSPKIILDPESNQFEFSGESRPENVRNFYMPILEWLEAFAGECTGKGKGGGDQPLEFRFGFEYFNSTSAKYILDVFKILHNIQEAGTGIQVKWRYEEDDEDMFEVGQEMARMSGLEFEYVEVEVE
jgi:hypothetical protein